MNNIGAFTYKTTFLGGLGIQSDWVGLDRLGMEFNPVGNEQ